jgi:membrane protease YdiL (CAAX protease family)
MPDSATLAVLRDIASLIVVAVTLGIAAYGALRMARPALAWNEGGSVIARHYSLADIYMAVLLGVFLLGGLGGPATAEEGGGGASFQTLLMNIVFMLSLSVALLLYLVVMRGLSPAELFGLRRLPPAQAARRAFVFIIPLYILVCIIAALAGSLTKDFWPDSGPQDVVKSFRSAKDVPMRAIMGVTAVIVAPLVEETVFRGFIYGVLKRYTDGWFAALCSAALFAVVHMHVGSFVPLFVLALGFCAAYERTGCLLVPMFMHAFFNGASTTILWLMPSAPN